MAVHTITLGSETFHAHSGQALLDAALVAGIDYPHDCRAGRCGACLTRVETGITLGGETRAPKFMHACQARVFSDLTLNLEPLPPVVDVKARLTGLTKLSHDVVELVIRPQEPLEMLPGQYCRFKFAGYQARCYSPTAPLDGRKQGREFRLNVKQIRDGHLSPNFGTAIRAGHHLTIEGPYGHAFFRPGQSGRLVVVGSGTGFAPVWAVANAALLENPRREMVIIGSARDLKSLYMIPALALASKFPNVKVVATAAEPQNQVPQIRHGSPTDHLPALRPSDIVYAAGAPHLVDAIGERAVAAGATLHADPFDAPAPEETSWIEKATSWLRAG